MTNGTGPAAGSPLAAGRTTGSPTDGPPSMQTIGAGGGQPGGPNQQNGPNNPMAALMSVADNLPPGSPQSARGSPPGSTGPNNAQAPGGPRSASRGSQHSPNSTGMYFTHDTKPPPPPRKCIYIRNVWRGSSELIKQKNKTENIVEPCLEIVYDNHTIARFFYRHSPYPYHL